MVRSEPSSLTMAHTVASLINHPRFVIINGKTGGLGSLNFVSSPRKPLVSLDLIQRTFGPHRWNARMNARKHVRIYIKADVRYARIYVWLLMSDGSCQNICHSKNHSKNVTYTTNDWNWGKHDYGELAGGCRRFFCSSTIEMGWHELKPPFTCSKGLDNLTR